MNLHTATIIATLAHHGQVDKAGRPYIKHPMRVAAHVPDDCKVIALLHDVIEDTWVTMRELYDWGLTYEQAVALSLLTHSTDTPYMDYVEAISNNPVARTVKIADLTDNMRLDRLPEVTDRDLKRQAKYQEALDFLTAQQTVA